ncbi:uncharacterized protein LY89DRAFT_777233 [Mollisia scopiformis]|uniref:RNase H type-1 domain-containing protein n=1 Tax=Mollisia scopiformis TaxID=149040 RepID=A0A194XTX6_MOLSC|nr:uncharacterized protein LY89DRAFT_777233 [Mollisia scopiformis]KUJ23489.1 hypothetical protein LY89DRAFT_777233 [Mollisia scopiformis]
MPVIDPSLIYAQRPLQVTCDRCSTSIRSMHYHYVHCEDYDICKSCAFKGIYCVNDTHEWQKMEFSDGGRWRVGAQMSPMGGKILRSQEKSYPSVFQPHDKQATPQFLFEDEHRYISKKNPREIMIYTDGSCLNNGQSEPKAGCAFVHRPSAYDHAGGLTHSEYVAVNATTRVEKWEKDNWKLADRVSIVKNQDLWKLLLKEIRTLLAKGVDVSFWRIPREWNERADKFARTATQVEGRERFHRIVPDGPIVLSNTYRC